ncbi:MAG: AMP-binding protein [Solirubrobacterales bacterium]|nr:AMP-binding protein [Solirubrobacterales bacterium]
MEVRSNVGYARRGVTVATDTPYWNPKTETLDRERIEALQLAKLRRQSEWAAARSPWYRGRFASEGFDPGQLRTLQDVRRIPLLTRDDWMASQEAKPPYGELPVIAGEGAIRIHTTSGTTGRGPLRALDSRKDWAWIAEMWCYGIWGCGIRPLDTAYIAFGYGSFIGFWGLHYAMEKVGVLNVPGGAQSTEARVLQIADFDATVLAATPTYAIRLAQEAERLGIDLRASKVSRLILSGEPAGSIPQTKSLIEDLWGAKAYDTAGMTEIGTIMVFECADQPGGTHIIEDHVLEEVIDPDTLEPVPYGERGERVVTSFGRGSTPLLRYRTGDLVCRIPAARCSCGRGFDIYEGGILGRVDDMKLIRGTNVYPRAIEAIVREYPEVEEFQTVIFHEGIRDEIKLRVELRPEASITEWERLRDGLHRRLGHAHEGLNFQIERAGAGELPRFELKAKRMVDLRERPVAVVK